MTSIRFYPRASSVLTVIALFLSLLMMPPALYANEEANYARELERDLNSVLEGRLGRSQYISTVEVTAVAKKETPEADAAIPFLPFKINKDSLRALLDDKQQALDFQSMGFNITLVVDESVPDQTLTTVRNYLRTRYFINDGVRNLLVQRSVIVPKDAPAPVGGSQQDSPNLELARLEAERTKAVLESERIRLELERAKMTSIMEQDKQAKRFEEEKVANEKKLADLEERIKLLSAPPKAEEPSVFKEFQWLIMTVAAVLGIVLAFLIAGFFVKAGMSTLSDGVKSVGSGVGNAMLQGVTAKIDHERAVLNASRKEAEEKTQINTTIETEKQLASDDWVAGNQEFESFVSKLQEKIEILSRERNYLFVRRFVDFGETDAKIGVAASILLALPKETAKTILDEIPVSLVDKLQAYLATPEGLAKAKGMRKQAIQDFYGAIALDEYSGSPLMSLSNLGWLTRLSSSELADLVTKIDTDLQPVLLSCFTQSRILKLVESARDPDAKNLIALAVAGIKDVDEGQIAARLKTIQALVREQEAGYRRPSMSSSIDVLKTVIFDLDPDQQEKLIRDMGRDSDLLKQLAKHYVPFRVIGTIQSEWINEIFSGLSNNDIALALFDLDKTIRAGVINALPKIQAESLVNELSVLDQDQKFRKRNLTACHRLQKELAKRIVRLRDSGAVEIEWPEQGSKPSQTQRPQAVKGVA